MKKSPNIKLTRAELQIMREFWAAGESSIREIQDRLAPKTVLAYTTVQTFVNRLADKGALQRSRKVGNAYMFAPLITQRSISKGILDEFLELFGGAEPLMSHLFESGQLTLEDLARLEKASRETRRARRRS